VPDPDSGDSHFTEYLNSESLVVSQGFVEPSVADDSKDQRYQFERLGYYWQDPEDSDQDHLVFNQIVPLRDTWAEDEEETESQAEIERKRREREREKERQRARSRAGERDLFADLTSDQRQRAEKYLTKLKLSREDAALIAREEDVAHFFEKTLETYEAPEVVAKWIVNSLIRVLKETSLEDLPFGPEKFGRFISLVDEGVINSRAADEVFETMVAEGSDPELIVDQKGLRQIEDTEALDSVIEEILEQNPGQVGQYRNGKKALLGFFMGQVMKKTKGAANPSLAKELLIERLES